MEFSLLKRRKLLLLFLLGVGLPSLALSLLAFRGIRNELALQEQRQADSYRSVAEEVSDTLAAHTRRAERAFSQIVSERTDPRSIALIRVLDSLKVQIPLVAGAFLLEQSGVVRLPTTDLLFRADGAIQPAGPSTWTGAAAEHLRNGQRHEFQANEFTQALASYRRAYDATPDSALKGEALLSSVRVQRKAGRLRAALADCSRLLNDFDPVRTSEGMPFGAIAYLEQSRLLTAAGDSVSALTKAVEFYGRLVGGQWELERAEYDFLSGEASALFRELWAGSAGLFVDSLARAFDSVTSRETARRSRAERLLQFQESAGEALLAWLERDAARTKSFPLRYSVESGGEPFLVSVFDRTGPDDGFWGLLLDAGHLEEVVLRGALEPRVDSSSTDWMIRGRDGRTILGSTDQAERPPTVTATFAGNFPPWLLEFYRRPENPYRRLLASAQSIYLYMFLAIATILVFGLVLTVRAVTHELDLARLKSDFVSTVSHEFKSPLTSIRQVAEMLHSGRVPSEERRQRYYDVLVEQSSRLSSLVTNVLDLARIEEGRREFQFEEVDLGALVRDLIEKTQHRVGHEGFEVTAVLSEPLPRVRGDSESLRQAVSNLLNNAIQYSGEARQVTVRTSAEGEVVTVAVEDSGIGIPEDDIGRVFDRFYRGEAEVTRSVPGSGLGLTLVKEIVEAHGGTVEVESRVGKGSTFTIHLPTMT